MDTRFYHSYLFFDLSGEYYQLGASLQSKLGQEFATLISSQSEIIITPYQTRGFKPDTTFMLWVRAADPSDCGELLGKIWRTQLGRYLKLEHTYFGMIRPSQYSGRTGKPEQVIQNHDDRLKYFVLYPFTKTHEWHQLSSDKRKNVMYEHMNIGVTYPHIRQCLLYSYGVDDYEFLVSYEMDSLLDFQTLVMELRPTEGRPYTLVDTPIYTCIYQPIKALMEAL